MTELETCEDLRAAANYGYEQCVVASQVIDTSALKNQPVKNVEEQGGVCHDVLITQVDICQLQLRHIEYELHHPYIWWHF